METKEMTFDKKVIDRLLKNAGAAYPKEGCGLLLGNSEENIVIDVCFMKNLAAAKRERGCFRIDPLSVYEAERGVEQKGRRIIGFYHSHPDAPAILSDSDREYMIPGMVYVVLSVWAKKTRGMRAYFLREADGEIASVRMEIME